jgi:predicted O-methyltransferase YrrM
MFTASWFKNNISLWQEKILPHLPNNPNILEIGVYEGYCTIWMCKNIPNCKIEIIDTFLGSMENNLKQDLLTAFKVNTFDYRNIININHGESYEHVRKFDKNYFDFIYVDGSHKAKDVLIDAVQSFYSLKKNGIMTFDDYEWSPYNDENLHPKKGINIFLDLFKDEIELIHKKYQVIIKKIK